jgi:hypothetical protein
VAAAATPSTAGARRVRPARGVVAATAALLVTVALALALAPSHAGSAAHSGPAAAPADLNRLIHGAPLQRARCGNWLGASPAERALASRALAGSVGAPTEYRGVRGTALTQSETYALLDGACSRPVARNFLIYELYIRAAGFRSVWTGRAGGSGL